VKGKDVGEKFILFLQHLDAEEYEVFLTRVSLIESLAENDTK
jgi:hypothetical protein